MNKRLYILKSIVFLTIFITCIYCILLYPTNISNYESGEFVSVKEKRVSDEMASDLPLILEWNTFNYGSTFAEEFIKKCPLKCLYTNDTSLEAVADMLTINFGNTRLKQLPQSRNPERLNVFISYEPPLHRPFYTKAAKDFFNITVTYRLDSDVLMLYDSFDPIQDPSEAWDQNEVGL